MRWLEKGVSKVGKWWGGGGGDVYFAVAQAHIGSLVLSTLCSESGISCTTLAECVCIQ
ncbi:unnamed protein product [Ectocarpus sp. 6 AP-2014]